MLDGQSRERYFPNLRRFAALFKGTMQYRMGIRDEVKSRGVCFDPFLADGPTYLNWLRTKFQHGQRRFGDAAHEIGSLKKRQVNCGESVTSIIEEFCTAQTQREFDRERGAPNERD
jgi:hypothetical protein